jgi:citrate synthase
MGSQAEFQAGLKGIIVAQSHICFIDGERGLLRYRGYDIRELARYSTFEETTYLLHYGELPTHEELERFSQELKEQRVLSEKEPEMICCVPKRTLPMDVLRTMVSALASFDPEADDISEEANRSKAIRLIAKMPTILAAFERIRQGLEPIPPAEDLGHAANFLYMLSGERPDEVSSHIFDVCLILHADHGFNASTFSARVTAATLADLYSAITSAISTLKGPLHGGANTRVLGMLQTIGSVHKVRAHLEGMLARNERIWGLGHRVYKTKDPRAIVLEGLIEELAAARGSDELYEVAREVERVGTELLAQKGAYPNVDFYSAVVYRMLGIPADLFTPIFAISRVSGWTAHVLEQYRDNVLIRPRAQYIGPPERPYVPIEERG